VKNQQKTISNKEKLHLIRQLEIVILLIELQKVLS